MSHAYGVPVLRSMRPYDHDVQTPPADGHDIIMCARGGQTPPCACTVVMAGDVSKRNMQNSAYWDSVCIIAGDVGKDKPHKRAFWY